MTTSQQTAEPLPAAAAARRAALDPVRPFYWSVRRELWENKSVWRAPLIIAGVMLAGFVLALLGGNHIMLDGSVPGAGGGPAVHGSISGSFSTGRGASISSHGQAIPVFVPYAVMGAVVVVTGLIVGAFYALGALHGERRDRSILFWKSLPVSDLTTVLAKLAIPLAVIPAATFATIVVLHLVVITLATAGMTSAGQDPALLWAQVPLARIWVLFLYALAANAIWQAPLWTWLLLVSAWAKRMPILWAVGAPLAVCIFERAAFGTSHASELLQERFFGGLGAAFDVPQHAQTIQLSDMSPLRYLAEPGLWLGLVAAAGMVAGAVWLRRRAEPI